MRPGSDVIHQKVCDKTRYHHGQSARIQSPWVIPGGAVTHALLRQGSWGIYTPTCIVVCWLVDKGIISHILVSTRKAKHGSPAKEGP